VVTNGYNYEQTVKIDFGVSEYLCSGVNKYSVTICNLAVLRQFLTLEKPQKLAFQE
jgi:hypothetical protein